MGTHGEHGAGGHHHPDHLHGDQHVAGDCGLGTCCTSAARRCRGTRVPRSVRGGEGPRLRRPACTHREQPRRGYGRPDCEQVRRQRSAC